MTVDKLQDRICEGRADNKNIMSIEFLFFHGLKWQQFQQFAYIVKLQGHLHF